MTIVRVNGQGLVIPGYYGKPKRRLLLTPDQLLDFQRRVLQADSSGGLAEWMKLAQWYVKWREQLSVAV